MIDFIDLLIKTNYCSVSQCILYFAKRIVKNVFELFIYDCNMENGFLVYTDRILTQEVHGPHRSTEK